MQTVFAGLSCPTKTGLSFNLALVCFYNSSLKKYDLYYKVKQSRCDFMVDVF